MGNLKNIEFTERDKKWVREVVEKFLQECRDETINPIAIHAALTILLNSCNDELRKDGIVVNCYMEDEIPNYQNIN